MMQWVNDMRVAKKVSAVDLKKAVRAVPEMARELSVAGAGVTGLLAVGADGVVARGLWGGRDAIFKWFSSRAKADKEMSVLSSIAGHGLHGLAPAPLAQLGSTVVMSLAPGRPFVHEIVRGDMSEADAHALIRTMRLLMAAGFDNNDHTHTLNLLWDRASHTFTLIDWTRAKALPMARRTEAYLVEYMLWHYCKHSQRLSAVVVRELSRGVSALAPHMQRFILGRAQG